MNRKSILTVCAVSLLFGSTCHSQSISIPRESTPSIRAIEATHFVNYMGMTPMESLASGPQNANKSVIVASRTVQPHESVGGASTYAYAWLQGLVSNSDLVVIGRPSNPVSDFTPDHSFLFSDYEFLIEEVLKDDTKALSTGKQIVVTRAGGVLKINGKKFRAVEPEFHQFQSDDRYVLFLHRLPDTGTYLVTAQGAFLLRSGLISSAKTHPRHLEKPVNETELIPELRSIVTKKPVQR